jgi:hypothetical protein
LRPDRFSFIAGSAFPECNTTKYSFHKTTRLPRQTLNYINAASSGEFVFIFQNQRYAGLTKAFVVGWRKENREMKPAMKSGRQRFRIPSTAVLFFHPNNAFDEKKML